MVDGVPVGHYELSLLSDSGRVVSTPYASLADGEIGRSARSVAQKLT